MRTLSSTVLSAIYAESTDKVFLNLVTIDHDDLSAPIRLVENTDDVVSRSNTYTAFPFRITIPADVDGEVPKVQFVVDNVSRFLVDEIRTLTSAPTVTLEVVLYDAPDDVEVGPFEFKLKSADYDRLVIESTVSFEEDFLTEPYPAGRFSPSDFPGLFSALS